MSWECVFNGTEQIGVVCKQYTFEEIAWVRDIEQQVAFVQTYIDTLLPTIATIVVYDIFKYIYMRENFYILTNISLKFFSIWQISIGSGNDLAPWLQAINRTNVDQDLCHNMITKSYTPWRMMPPLPTGLGIRSW